MTIDPKYRPQAQRASDLLYTALGAVEDCGADENLTAIVVDLSNIREDLATLFDLPAGQVERVIKADDIYPLDPALTGRAD